MTKNKEIKEIMKGFTPKFFNGLIDYFESNYNIKIDEGENLKFQKKKRGAEPRFKVEKGKWVVTENDGVVNSIEFVATNPDSDGFVDTYGWSKNGSYKDHFWVHDTNHFSTFKRDATKDEVIDMIKKQIDNRGYGANMSVGCLLTSTKDYVQKLSHDINSLRRDYLFSYGEVIVNSGIHSVILMKDGVWAEIIEEKESIVPDNCDWWESEIHEGSDFKYCLHFDGAISLDEDKYVVNLFTHTYHTIRKGLCKRKIEIFTCLRWWK